MSDSDVDVGSEDFEMDDVSSESEDVSLDDESDDDGKKKKGKKKQPAKKTTPKKKTEKKSTPTKAPRGKASQAHEETKSSSSASHKVAAPRSSLSSGTTSSTSMTGGSSIGMKRKEPPSVVPSSTIGMPSSASHAGHAGAGGGGKPVKELVGAEAEEAILRYMTAQNRPYLALQVSENLHDAVKKGAAQKILDTLCDEGKLVNKLYGKSKIYHVNQDTLPVADADTIAALDNRIKELSQQLSSIQQQHSALSHSLSQMENAPSTEDAIKLVEKLKAENASRLAEVTKLETAAGSVQSTDLTAIKKQFAYVLKEWRRRKRACNEMMDLYLDNVTKTKKVFMREQGIEGDEEHKVDIQKYIKMAEDMGCPTK